MQAAPMLSGILPIITLNGVPLSWPVISTILGNSYFFVITATLLFLFLVGVCLIYKYTPQMLNDLRAFTNNDLADKGLIMWMIFHSADTPVLRCRPHDAIALVDLILVGISDPC